MDNNDPERPRRCGCRVPLIFDRMESAWRHLDDLSPCEPGRPRPGHLPVSRPRPSVYRQVIAHLRAQATVARSGA